MTGQTPSKVTNLDQYGSAALPWSRPLDLLAASPAGDGSTYFLGTVRPDGRPHCAAVGALWHDGGFYIVSGPATQKSRNLAANPACTISAQLDGLDLVLEGDAARVTDPAALAQVARLYNEAGWPAEVQGDAFTAPYTAPSGGPPPWYVYRFTVRAAVGVATAEPYGATRWQFGR